MLTQLKDTISAAGSIFSAFPGFVSRISSPSFRLVNTMMHSSDFACSRIYSISKPISLSPFFTRSPSFTLFYPVSVFYESFKTFSVQIHGIHADVDEILHSVVAHQPYCVF